MKNALVVEKPAPKFNYRKVVQNSSDDIERAREYPIDNLLHFNGQKKCKCIWHKEKTDSLTYYPETNTVFCFGCGKSGDSIDVAQQLWGCDFLSAIKKLM